MSEREVNPRIGGRTDNYRDQYVRERNHPSDDLDINAYIERTPKTNEQTNREKSSTGWEYSFWMVVIIGIIVILIILVIWFMFKKDDNTELQKQIHPHRHVSKQQPNQQQPNQQQPNQQQPNQQQQEQQCKNDDHEDMDDQARANLAKKKTVKKNIGPVPGEIPDNPSVVGIIPQTAKNDVIPPVKAESVVSNTTTPVVNTAQVDALPDIQANAIFNRLTTNLGLEAS
jgi:cytoskeletal protein RodZ